MLRADNLRGTADEGPFVAGKALDNGNACPAFGEHNAPGEDCGTGLGVIADDDRVVAGMIGRHVNKDATTGKRLRECAKLVRSDSRRAEGASQKLGMIAGRRRRLHAMTARSRFSTGTSAAASLDGTGIG